MPRPLTLATLVCASAFSPLLSSKALTQEPRPGASVQRAEFIYEQAPFPSAHASTIAETKESFVAAWFGGTREGASDVGIWVARLPKAPAARWTAPTEVATGQEGSGTRHPCWNPVLVAAPDGALSLYYKVGPSPQTWWGVRRLSRDGGQTWGEPQRLPDGILGPVKNKPVSLGGRTLLSGSSTESTEKPSKWRLHFERSTDGGQTWSVVRPADGQGAPIDAIQPSILVHPKGRLQAVGRSRSQRVFETWSEDGGLTWGPVTLTALPNPNSGTDAVTLQDGRHAIVYNHTQKGRSPLNLALSRDGKAWDAAVVLESEPGEYSYPAVIQASDGLVHVTYTWRRLRIKHVVLDPKQVRPVPMPDGVWPADVK